MKKSVIISCFILLIWFFLDMTRLYFEDTYLVTQSFKDDWIFFVIYLVCFLIFIIKEKIGKYLLYAWLLMWFVTQFICHWYFTLTGGGLDKIEYFNGSIKIIDSSSRYYPDLYHVVLHVLILISFVLLNVYIFKDFKKTNS
jgi:hypothetical protein